MSKFQKLISTKNTLSNVFFFSVLEFLKPAIGIFLLPLYMKELSTEDYGILSLVLVFSSFIGVLASFKLDTAIRTYYFDYNSNEKDLWNYISQIFTVVLSISIGITLLLLLIGPVLFDLIFNSGSIIFYPLGLIAVLTSIITAICTVFFIYLKNKVELKKFLFYSLLHVVLTLVIQVVLVIGFEMKIKGVLYGSLFSILIVFIAILLRNPKLINFKWQKKLIVPSLKFSIPLVPLSLLLVFGKQIDKVLIERFMDLGNVGVYSVLMTLVGVSLLSIGALSNGIRPFLYQSLKNNNQEAKATTDLFKGFYLFVGLISISGVILLGCNLNIFTSNESYLAVQEYIVWAAISIIPFFLVGFLNILIVYHKKSKSLTIGMFIQAITAFVLMMILIPYLGIYGAITSLAISQVINFIVFTKALNNVATFRVSFYNEFLKIGLFLTIVLSLFFMLFDWNITVFSIVQFVSVLIILIFLDKKRLLRLINFDIQ